MNFRKRLPACSVIIRPSSLKPARGGPPFMLLKVPSISTSVASRPKSGNFGRASISAVLSGSAPSWPRQRLTLASTPPPPPGKRLR
jgi:hypothetical protein